MEFEKGFDSSSKNVNVNHNLSALIVVDNAYPLIRNVHSKLLEDLGVQVLVAKNGQDAVELHLLGSSFDIILIDMAMPIMNGPDVTKELRKMGVDSMIVGVTGWDVSPFDWKVFMEAGINFCLKKPLNVDKLSCILQELN